MRVVLYTHDMEPITVIELQPWAWDFLREHRSVRLAVHRPVDARRNHDIENVPQFDMSSWIVNITADVLVRGKYTTLMLFTHDEEAALLLKSELLPGQHRDVQDREKAAFANGLLFALNNLR